jgi:2-furoyl-CoA dehydrogenase 2Fe-2S iron sulfur subunit
VTDPHTIRVAVNGIVYERTIEARLLLGDFLRETLNLTGTHFGREHGIAGRVRSASAGTAFARA